MFLFVVGQITSLVVPLRNPHNGLVLLWHFKPHWEPALGNLEGVKPQHSSQHRGVERRILIWSLNLLPQLLSGEIFLFWFHSVILKHSNVCVGWICSHMPPSAPPALKVNDFTSPPSQPPRVHVDNSQDCTNWLFSPLASSTFNRNKCKQCFCSVQLYRSIGWNVAFYSTVGGKSGIRFWLYSPYGVLDWCRFWIRADKIQWYPIITDSMFS